MRVIVQRLGTELFLDEAGAWTGDVARAKDFSRTADAVVYCVTQNLIDVRIGMIFGDPKMDVYFYPFQRANRDRTQELGARNEALKMRQKVLIEEAQDALAEIAEQAKALPLRRKKKRERPLEE